MPCRPRATWWLSVAKDVYLKADRLNLPAHAVQELLRTRSKQQERIETEAARGDVRKHQYDEDRELTIANAKRLWEADQSIRKNPLLDQIDPLQQHVLWRGSRDTRWEWIKQAHAKGLLAIPSHVQNPGRPRG